MNQRSITIGVYGALTLIAYSALTYLGGVEIMAKWWVGMLMLPIMIAILVWSGRAAKKANGSFITLKQAFLAIFTTSVVMSLISVVFGLLLYNVIDKDLGPRLADEIITNTEKMMEGFGMPDADIDKAIDEMEEDIPTGFTPMGQLKQLLQGLVMQAVIAIIIAAIIKRKAPEFNAATEVLDN